MDGKFGDSTSIDALKKRIKGTDLVPSRTSLLNGIDEYFDKLTSADIKTFGNLRDAIKNAKNIPKVADKTGIPEQYVSLLRREIEGYVPRAFPLKEFAWFPKSALAKLEKAGFKNTVALYEALNTPEKRKEAAASLRFDGAFMDALFSLTSLTRIQWVSPLYARMLVEAGYDGVQKIAKADAEKVCGALETVNKGGVYFKGKVGLRDVKRLINAAGWV